MANGAKRTSPWIYVALGCLGAVVALVVVVVGLGVYGAKKIADYGEAMADPAHREEQVKSILGLEAIPEGYHALLGMRVPFLIDFAMLTDLESDSDDIPSGFDNHGFIYASFLQPDDNERQKLLSFFEGTTNDIEVLRDQGYQMDIQERLNNGSLDFENRQILWVSTRANFRGDDGFERHGLANIILVNCDDDDSRQRMAVWFGPLPSGGSNDSGDAASASGGESAFSADSLRGTVGDPIELEQFMGPMDLCSS